MSIYFNWSPYVWFERFNSLNLICALFNVCSSTVIRIIDNFVQDLASAVDLPIILLTFEPVESNVKYSLLGSIPGPIRKIRIYFSILATCHESSGVFLELFRDCNIRDRRDLIVLVKPICTWILAKHLQGVPYSPLKRTTYNIDPTHGFPAGST